jgi:hypothetical protein
LPRPAAFTSLFCLTSQPRLACQGWPHQYTNTSTAASSADLTYLLGNDLGATHWKTQGLRKFQQDLKNQQATFNAQAGRASDVRLQTETQSRPCLQPVC